MTGYEQIRNMPDTKISSTFGVSIEEAVKIRNCSLEEMILHPEVCKEKLGINGNCRKETTLCSTCNKEFLENDRL